MSSSRRGFLGGLASIAIASPLVAATTKKGNDGKIVVSVINGIGNSFSQKIEIKEGMNISELVKQQTKRKTLKSLVIKVNREYVEDDYILSHNDRISITPKNIEGA